MFRNPLHPIVCFLMAAAALAAGPARAALDLSELRVDVIIAKSSEAQDDITAEIRLVGTDLTNARITLPSAPGMPIDLEPDGDDFVLGIDFESELQLNTVLPAGSYTISVNNGARTDTFSYQRPTVPSPAITQPGAGEVIPPGPVEVLFTPCAVCTQLADTVAAELFEGMTEIASDELTEADDSWIPSDGVGGDLQLGESSEFTARITHTAIRQSDETATPTDPYTFTHSFSQSDAHTFETGFNPPIGDFCIVVNDLTPPAGCGVVNDALLSILDPSGPVSTQVAGHDVDYDFDVGAKGEISGAAMADLDDNGSKETVAPLDGKLSGKAGEARSKLSFSLENPGPPAKLKVSVSDELSIPGDVLTRLQRASGAIGDTKVKEDVPSNVSPLPVAAQGWRVDFTLDGTALVQNGMLTLEGGRSFELEGNNKFNIASDLSSMKLTTADNGISIQLKKLGLDDGVAPPAVTGGDVSFKILGQSGKVSLP